jgi:hypothetical protein
LVDSDNLAIDYPALEIFPDANIVDVIFGGFASCDENGASIKIDHILIVGQQNLRGLNSHLEGRENAHQGVLDGFEGEGGAGHVTNSRRRFNLS